MPRNIYSIPSVMQQIEIISVKEEDRYSEIPAWNDMIEQWTDKAVLIGKNWFPISQLRKTEDGSEIYASIWILEQNGY